MTRPTSFDRVCCPKAMIACHARRRPIVCAVQRRGCHATPDAVERLCCPRAVMSFHAPRCRPCLLSKGSDVMHRPMMLSFVLSKGTDVMPLSTLPIVCAVQGWECHFMPDVDYRFCLRAVMSCHARHCRPCVLSKGGDVMPCPTMPTVCVVQG